MSRRFYWLAGLWSLIAATSTACVWWTGSTFSTSGDALFKPIVSVGQFAVWVGTVAVGGALGWLSQGEQRFRRVVGVLGLSLVAWFVLSLFCVRFIYANDWYVSSLPYVAFFAVDLAVVLVPSAVIFAAAWLVRALPTESRPPRGIAWLAGTWSVSSALSLFLAWWGATTLSMPGSSADILALCVQLLAWGISLAVAGLLGWRAPAVHSKRALGIILATALSMSSFVIAAAINALGASQNAYSTISHVELGFLGLIFVLGPSAVLFLAAAMLKNRQLRRAESAPIASQASADVS